MKYQKIINLLDNTSNQACTLSTKIGLKQMMTPVELINV